MGKLKEFTIKLADENYCDNISGQISARGQVYAVLRDYLIGIENDLDDKTKDVRSDLADVQFDQLTREEKLAQRAELLQNNVSPAHCTLCNRYIVNRLCMYLKMSNFAMYYFTKQGHYQEVLFTSKDLLEFVLASYGLDDPQYINGPDQDSLVKSTVHFEFPYMPAYKYGGKLEIAGKAYNSVEANEEAAYEALLFIEDYFNTKVVDYNYSRRKKAVKEQNKLMLMLHRTLNLADSVKMLFGEAMNAIQGKRRQFSFDPTSFFAGPMSTGQIDAYRFCAKGLAELDKYSADCYVACEENFDVLQKLTWKLTVAKTSLHL